MNIKGAQSIAMAKGASVIGLGFWLNKKPNKTPAEAMAAKAFLKTFWGSLGLTLLFAVVLFILTGYMLAGESLGYQGNYDEARTGRIENGQIRYVKNELYYIDPERVGLSAELPEGTHVNLYFDENGNVIAGENADLVNQEMESRVILLLVALIGMIVALLLFALIAKKTFGRPWYQWLQSVRGC